MTNCSKIFPNILKEIINVIHNSIYGAFQTQHRLVITTYSELSADTPDLHYYMYVLPELVYQQVCKKLWNVSGT